MDFDLGCIERNGLRGAIAQARRLDERSALVPLIDEARLPADALARAQSLAADLASRVRAQRSRGSGIDTLMREFSLGTEEGVALMCLAEALLRIPDAATVDRLIRDKLPRGDWSAHLGNSPSLFVNAAAWGLLVTGKLVEPRDGQGLAGALTNVLRSGGEPLIRAGVGIAMRMLGDQFVAGRTIDEALDGARDARAQGFRFSFDMLGEAALTADDVERYLDAYRVAIERIGAHEANRGLVDGDGLSVKLSALHPRYARAQRDRVMRELLPRLASLMRLAREHDIGINLDAEEADRLELSLDVLEALCADRALDGWNGVGFVIQAYQRRAPAVVDFVVDLARRTGRRMMVRLVKGAYWDGEIKRAQVEGVPDYPVFTRKVHTDVAYLACARRLLAAPDAVYPQFATHNAMTIATLAVMGQGSDFEYQCLHGMGETLYREVIGPRGLGRRCRIYAPVGTHETLLAYLVRRLLENGANTSFVNRIVDPAVSLAELVADPVAQAARDGGTPHPRIALPGALFADRRNSRGFDFADERTLCLLARDLATASPPARATPLLAADRFEGAGVTEVRNPADHDEIVGEVVEASPADVARALDAAGAAAVAHVPVAVRAGWLDAMADALEAESPALMALMVREAGKTLPNAAGEVREAVDFCRYYAAQLRVELDAIAHAPLGVVACVSPWNFPLSIFTGQVAAALAGGNAVLAKPAEQTPLTAYAAVSLFHRAGVPHGRLQLLPGRGETVGAALVADARVAGVLFTGSTAVARAIERTLAARSAHHDPVLVAETGGQNAMIVDSSALPEQVVADAIASAFDSAGQRCSALRVLCLQRDIADRTLALLEGAMAELSVGPPSRLSTDVGPVIDDDARAMLLAHVARMGEAGCRIHQRALPEACERGTFMPPTLVEIPSLALLEREVFGPVLHVLRYERDALPALVDAINATGYGLTHGIHTRIDATVAEVARRVRAGNVYVNRSIVGAVVGVQPFGGEGLSGTGPKAGGPLYLHRLIRATGHRARAAAPARDVAVLWPGQGADSRAPDASTVVAWLGSLSGLDDATRRETIARIGAYAQALDAWHDRELPGPTGERNVWTLRPRGVVACVAPSLPEAVHQLALTALTGNSPWIAPGAPGEDAARRLRDRLGHADVRTISAIDDADAVLFAGTASDRHALRERLARREGPLVPIVVADAGGRYPAWRLKVERVVSIDTTAQGGNASLMALAGT